jgi:hypothetical protein
MINQSPKHLNNKNTNIVRIDSKVNDVWVMVLSSKDFNSPLAKQLIIGNHKIYYIKKNSFKKFKV